MGPERAASQNTTFLDGRFSLQSTAAASAAWALLVQPAGGPRESVVSVMSQPTDGATRPGAVSPDVGCSILRFPVLFPSSCHLVRRKGKRGRGAGWEKMRPEQQELITSRWVEIPTLCGGGVSTAPPALNPVTQNSSLVMDSLAHFLK